MTKHTSLRIEMGDWIMYQWLKQQPGGFSLPQAVAGIIRKEAKKRGYK